MVLISRLGLLESTVPVQYCFVLRARGGGGTAAAARLPSRLQVSGRAFSPVSVLLTLEFCRRREHRHTIGESAGIRTQSL